MTDAPKIPFGYVLVTGQAQKGDGVWNGERFAKAKKVYPSTVPAIIIRKAVVTQTQIPQTIEPEEVYEA